MFSELEFQRQVAKALAEDAPAPTFTDRELVEVVALAALEVRRVRNRLGDFRAGSRGNGALEMPLAAFEAAVDRLAAARGVK